MTLATANEDISPARERGHLAKEEGASMSRYFGIVAVLVFIVAGCGRKHPADKVTYVPDDDPPSTQRSRRHDRLSTRLSPY